MSNLDQEMKEPPAQINTASKKRTYEEFIRPENIVHRFKAKSDFKQYFSESRKSRIDF